VNQVRTPRSRPVVRIVGVVACVAIAGVAILFVLATRPPSWWVPPAVGDPAVRALGERVEQRLVEEATRIREGDGDWAIRLTEQQANAWLAGRLPQWIAHADGAAAGRAPTAQVHFETDRLVVAIAPPIAPSFTPVGGQFVATSAFALTVKDGMLSIADLGGSVGALRVPFLSATKGKVLELLAEAIASSAASQTDHVALLLRAFAGEPIAASFDLGDGRTLELLDLEIVNGEIRIAARTARRLR